MSNLARNIKAIRHAAGTPVTDVPIEYSIPYNTRIKGASRHYGFFPFFVKKPWPVVQKYIEHYTSPGDTVCDSFAGSGVTLVESLVLGRKAVGSDINPLACFITQMTAVSPVNIQGLKLAIQFVASKAKEPIESLTQMPEEEIIVLLSRLNYPRTPIPSTVRRTGADTVDQLHTPRQLAGLSILRDAINQVQEDIFRKLLLVALGRTVRYANKTYSIPRARDGKSPRSPYSGDALFLRRFSYSLASESRFYEHLIWPTFELACENVIKAKEETNSLIGTRYNKKNFQLFQEPASNIHNLVGEGTVDYCFTDPPYTNDIYFLDLSTIWAAWLDLIITDKTRKLELLEGGVKAKSREQYEQEFASSMESIARCLKNDRWLTLVYKHRDLSLWQTIVNACEQSGLKYINAVWQDLKIASTRQIENPNINPSGDMYLNFRKMSRQKFVKTYPKAVILDLPTRPRYVEKEIERLIVSYLGADIKIIVSGVIQQILDSRAFKNYRENPDSLNKDIQTVLKSPHFEVWQPNDEANPLWVLGQNVTLDPSLPPIDRARYYVFSYLRANGEATEGEVSRHLLTCFSETPGKLVEKVDIPALLRQVGKEIGHRRWQFDVTKVTKYKQLRLLFQHSRVDEIREAIEEREVEQYKPLRPNFEGITLLMDRLSEANRENDRYESQSKDLLRVLKIVLSRLVESVDIEVEKVLAINEWAQHGVDLRNLAFEDVILHIVLRSEDISFEIYKYISERVFNDLNDDEILIQFQLSTITDWESASKIAQSNSREDILGISLLDRS